MYHFIIPSIPRIHGQCIIKFQKYFLSVYFPANQVSGTEMSKWLNELCPIILDMLQDASLIAKREVTTPVRRYIVDKEMDEIQDSVKTIWLLLFYFLSFIKLCQTKLYCLLLVNMFILYLVWHCIVVYLHASLWWYAMRTVQCMHLVHWHQYQCVFNQQIALWTLGQLVESTG